MARTAALIGALWAVLASSLAAQEARPKPTRPPTDPEAKRWEASGTRGAVAAGGAEAVAAGVAMLRDGGNAIDAAVTTILAQTVTDANAFCFGGEVPILIYNADRHVVEVIAGMGAAPRLATREHFAKAGGIPRQGAGPAAVPATLDALLTALARHGTRSFADCARPTLAILDRAEHPWHADLARTLRLLLDAEAKGADRDEGLRLAADAFYRGPIAIAIDAWARENGALLRYEDLAAHVTRVESPVTVAYRGHTVAKCGPWTQGPALLQALQLLEGFEPSAAGTEGPDAIHLPVEALKLALADRDVYYGDPLFVRVPLAALLAPSYAASRRSLIDPERASLVQRPGDPAAGAPLLGAAAARRGLGNPDANDTTTCVVADAAGNVVAATPSGWSGVLAGDTGVWLGSRLQSFNTWEGHPNVIAPGKRPRITLTPTLLLKDGRAVAAVSVAGGDLQDQVSLQMVLALIDHELPPAAAVTRPRFSTDHHVGSFGQAPPRLGSLTVNESVGPATIAALEQRGHVVKTARGPIAAPVVLRIVGQTIEAAGDPKAGRHAGAP